MNRYLASILFLLITQLKQIHSSLQNTLQDSNARETVENVFGFKLIENFNSLNPGKITPFTANGFEFYDTGNGYFIEINTKNIWTSIQQAYGQTIKMKLLNKSIIYYALQIDQPNGKYDNMNCIFLGSDQYESLKNHINSNNFSFYPQAYTYQVSVPKEVCRKKGPFYRRRTVCEIVYNNEDRTGYHQILCYNYHSGVGTLMWNLAISHFQKKFGYSPSDFAKQCPDYGFDLNSYCIPNCDICSTHLKCSVCNSQYALQQGYCVQCHEYCDRCTQPQNPKQCVACSNLASMFEGECVKECPDSYYNKNRVCLKCDSACATCNQWPNYCQSCNKGFYLQGNSCVDFCKKGTYADEDTRTCMKCHGSCTECTGPNNNQCQSCSENYCLNSGNLCISSCNPIEGKTRVCNYKTRVCEPCHKSCQDCNAVGSEMCIECYKPLYRQTPEQINTTCDDKCFDGKASDNNNDCKPCKSPCAVCRDLTINNCVSCIEGYYLHMKKFCLKVCPDGFTESGKECVKCESNCRKCQSDNRSQCLECYQGFINIPDEGTCVQYFDGFKCKEDYYLLNKSKCVIRCPEGLYADQVTQECQSQCSDGYNIYDNWICIVCLKNMMKIQDKKCVFECSQGYYFDNFKAECFKCHSSCQDCSGPQSNNCLSCRQPLFFSDTSECKQMCKEGEFFIKEAKKCERCHFSCAVCDSKEKECIYCKQQYNYYFTKPNKKVECLVDCTKKGDQVMRYNNNSFKQCLSNIIDSQNSNNNPSNNTNQNITGLMIDPKSSSCLLINSSKCQLCQEGYYLNESKCQKCYTNCKSCYGPNPNQCKTCFKGSLSKDGTCYNQGSSQNSQNSYHLESPYSYSQLDEKYKSYQMPLLGIAQADFIKQFKSLPKDLKVKNIGMIGCLLTSKAIILANQGITINGIIVNPANYHMKIYNDPLCYSTSYSTNSKLIQYSSGLNSCIMEFDDGLYQEKRQTISIEDFSDKIKQAYNRQQNGEKIYYLIKLSGLRIGETKKFPSHFVVFKRFVTDDIIEIYDVASQYYVSRISLKGLQYEKDELLNIYKKLKIEEIRETYFTKVKSPKESLAEKSGQINNKLMNQDQLQKIKQSLQNSYKENVDLKQKCEKSTASLKSKNLTEERQILLVDLCFNSKEQMINDTQFISKLKENLDNNLVNKFIVQISNSSYFKSAEKSRKQILLKLIYNKYT